MGAQLRVYRQKIKSAQTTKKITRAMELIAASRIQKAQARVTASTPYSRAITRAVSAVATYSNVDHVLTTEPETIERAAVVIFTSDRGLAGAFNSQVLARGGGAHRAAAAARARRSSTSSSAARRSATSSSARARRSGSGSASTENPEFETREGDRRRGARGVPPGRRRRRRRRDPHRLQPLRQHDDAGPRGRAPAAARGRRGCRGARLPTVLPLYEFEPDAETVLDALLPVYIESRIFNALLQSAAAKHAATQKAMKSASDNADKLITRLHPPREQRAPGRDHAADLRDRGRRRRARRRQVSNPEKREQND